MPQVTIPITVMQESFNNLHVYSFTATFDQWPGTDVLLERIFTSGNIGALRNRLVHSLSVGDKVDLGPIAGMWECASHGWDFCAPVDDVVPATNTDQ